EHLDILRQLTHALGDDRVPEALTRADTPPAVLEILAGDIHLPAGEEPQTAPQFYEEATFILRNPNGIQVLSSAELVKPVKQVRSQILVENLDPVAAIVDAKNVVRVLSLCAKQGQGLHFMA
ncbi:HPr family phosphocarrier protein, partial [Klebsiella pneumoniae]